MKRDIGEASDTISTSSGPSLAKARQAATSASLSKVPWSIHGALTYCLSPPVVRNTEEDGSYVSLIHASPRFTGHGPGRKLRRLWYDAREGARKRLAFARLVIAAHGVVRGGRETLNL